MINNVKYKLLLAIVALSLQGCSPACASPDYTKLCWAIRRVENGVTLNKGELYGIHSVHYKNATEARKIAIRTARHAWKRYLTGNRLEITKKGYLNELSKTYCPVNARNWARMVGYYYNGGV